MNTAAIVCDSAYGFYFVEIAPYHFLEMVCMLNANVNANVNGCESRLYAITNEMCA